MSFIWDKFTIDKLIAKPTKSPIRDYPNANLIENNTLNNSYLSWCFNSKCHKTIYLRESDIFNYFPRTAASNILYIIKLWLIDNHNATEIYNKFKNDCQKININLILFTKILQKIKAYIMY